MAHTAPAPPVTTPNGSGGPVHDLAAVQADNHLLDLIGTGVITPSDEDRLARTLAAWRQHALQDPIPDLLDTRTALVRIRAAQGMPARSYLLCWVAAAWAVAITATVAWLMTR